MLQPPRAAATAAFPTPCRPPAPASKPVPDGWWAAAQGPPRPPRVPACLGTFASPSPPSSRVLMLAAPIGDAPRPVCSGTLGELRGCRSGKRLPGQGMPWGGLRPDETVMGARAFHPEGLAASVMGEDVPNPGPGGCPRAGEGRRAPVAVPSLPQHPSVPPCSPPPLNPVSPPHLPELNRGLEPLPRIPARDRSA